MVGEMFLQWADLLRHVPASRIGGRVTYAASRRLASRLPSQTAHRWSLPALVMPRWPLESSSRALASGRVTPVGIIFMRGAEIDTSRGWVPRRQDDTSRLANFDLHGWEWFWSQLEEDVTVARRQRFPELWASWGECHPFPYGDAWHPFVVSTRIWVLLDLFDSVIRGGDAEQSVRDHLSLAGGYLMRHMEHFIGGNHLIRNWKALTGTAFALGCVSSLQYSMDRFSSECEAQHLDDGGHIERSPSYHAHVLADMLDVAALGGSLGIRIPPLTDCIERSRGWLSAIQLPDGSCSPFNDSSRLNRGALDALEVPQDAGSGTHVHLLHGTGFAKMARNGWCLVAETGGPGPREHPGHAHAGTLGFELMVDGQLIICDSGASEYSGSRRAYERSSEAHSVVRVDRENSTAVWGDFRASMLASGGTVSAASSDDAAHLTARAQFGGRVRFVRHERLWTLTSESLEIEDLVEGSGFHYVETILHVAPGITPVASPTAGTVWVGPVQVRFEDAGKVEVSVLGPDAAHAVAPGVGQLNDASVIVASGMCRLPLRRRVVIEGRRDT